jgi:hypothetical protein
MFDPSHLRRSLIFGAVVSVLGFASGAQAMIIGLPADATGNSFPFGYDFGGTNTRYQQVYDASNFAGPIDIAKITFFKTVVPGGSLASGDYTFSLSTTSVAVNALDPVNFDNNLGPDNQLFNVFTLAGGLAPTELSFAGTPFDYDPTSGNLLLDIQIAGFSHSGGAAAFDARNGTAGGIFSSAHNFSSSPATDNFGLVTAFAPVPEPTAAVLFGVGFALVSGAMRSRSAAARPAAG